MISTSAALARVLRDAADVARQLARAVHARLAERGMRSLLLDSDNVRKTISPPPGYDLDSRNDFYTTLGRLASLIARHG